MIINKCLTIILFLLSILSYGQNQTEVENFNDEYYDDITKGYRSYLVSTKPLRNLGVLDSSLTSNQLYFIKEVSRFENENINIKLELIKYLHKKVQLKHIIIDKGEAEAYLMNQYLSGNNLYSIRKGDLINEEFDFVRKLKNLKDSINPDPSFIIHGSDVLSHPKNIFTIFDFLLEEKDLTPISDNLKFQVNVIKKLAQNLRFNHYGYGYSIKVNPQSYSRNNNHSNYIIAMDSVYRAYSKSIKEFELLLVNDFKVFDSFMRTLSNYLKWHRLKALPQGDVYRGMETEERLKRLFSEYPKEKFYAQWRTCRWDNSIMRDCNWFKANDLAKSNSSIKILKMRIQYGKYPYENYSNFSKTNPRKKEFKGLIDQNFIERTKSSYSSDYNYYIYNYTNYEKSDDYYHSANEKSYYSSFSSFDISLGQATYDFSNLNQKMFATDELNNNFYHLNIGFTIAENNYYHVTKMKKLLDQKISFENASYRFSGYGIYQSHGVYLNTGNKLLLAPHANIGYNRLNLRSKSDSFNFSPNSGFSNIDRTKHSRNALSVGGGLDLRIKLTNELGLFVNSAYNFDLSGKKWRSGRIDEGSPSTSLTNWQLIFGISFVSF